MLTLVQGILPKPFAVGFLGLPELLLGLLLRVKIKNLRF